jgi:hypothetical protein
MKSNGDCSYSDHILLEMEVDCLLETCHGPTVSVVGKLVGPQSSSASCALGNCSYSDHILLEMEVDCLLETCHGPTVSVVGKLVGPQSSSARCALGMSVLPVV